MQSDQSCGLTTIDTALCYLIIQPCCWQAESWAFALDSHSLGMLIEKGIFWMRLCKLCDGDDGIVVASEYGMSKVILEAGFNLATLMARCAISIPAKSLSQHVDRQH